VIVPGGAHLRVSVEGGAAEPPPGVTEAAVPRAGGGGLNLTAVLGVLWDRGVRSVLVEGGAAVADSFVRVGHPARPRPRGFAGVAGAPEPALAS